MTTLGTLGGTRSEANGVSADGRYVVGMATNPAEAWRAFRWDAQTGFMQDLGDLGRGLSVAYAVSADGRVVVGSALRPNLNGTAFRWVEGTMQDLGTLGGNWSEAYGVSADGQVVVGISHDQNGWWRPFRWTPRRGMEDLNTLYASQLTDGSWLEAAYDVSADGRWIVGYGYRVATGRYEAFLADTRITGDANNDGCVDDADLLLVLLHFGSAGPGDVNEDGTVDDT
ncbi:MAG: hypothetical protein NZ949_08660, partial [Candidatus Kapabacteria bacterium]|nr:hypothetical protein [Candidatus Kapabacteria bacterium]